ARLQQQVRILDVDDRRVGHDVLLDDGLQPYGGDAAGERTIAVRVDGEGHGLPGPDAPDVALVDVRLDLHALEITGDHEQRRRLQAGRHGLPDLDVPAEHDPRRGRA